MPLTIGLPRMHKERGERRDFLPRLVSFLERVGAGAIVVEEGYGTGMGLAPADYLAASGRCRVGTYEECLAQDVVAVLRYPADDALRRMRPGSVLVSMVHYPTRPGRITNLTAWGLRAVSLDEVADDHGNRLVENLAAVGWNGIKSAFDVLVSQNPRFDDSTRGPLRVTLLGAGAVAAHAMRAAAVYGDPKRRAALAAKGVRGVEVTVIDFDLARDEAYLQSRLEQTDLLVDCTKRPDPTRLVVRNEWLKVMPKTSVICDLAVDPYDFSIDPPEVKAIEGVPEGNLDQFVFAPDDPVYQRMDPRVRTAHRRTALSCYSWPGVEPRECMEIYGAQVEPVLRVVFERGLDAIDPLTGPHYDRAVARAELHRWKAQHA